MFDCVRDGSDFIVRTNEGFSSISGSVYANSSFNIWYSPARNLRRWGGELKAGLIKKLTSILTWQASDKNSTLVSQLATEASEVVENANIVASELKDSRYLLEEFYGEAPITTAQLNAVDSNRNGLIKLSDTKYGWINKFEPSTENQMVRFELLKCNLDIVTPT